MKKVYSNRALNLLYLFITHNDMRHATILLPTNICHDVFFLLKHIGSEIVFLDIDSETLEMNTGIAMGQLDIQAKTILFWNHTYGNPLIPFDFFKAAKSKNPNLVIIDDRCLCDPDNFKLLKEDEIIDLIIYSTGNRKQVDLNYGALGLANSKYNIPSLFYDFDEHIYAELKQLFNGGDLKGLMTILRTAWIQISFDVKDGLEFENQIISEKSRWKPHKKKLSDIYNEELGDKFAINEKFNGWRFNILVENKNEIFRLLKNEGLFVSNHYPSIGSIFNIKDFPVAEHLHKHVVNLFIDKHYSTDMAYKTARIIRKYGNPI